MFGSTPKTLGRLDLAKSSRRFHLSLIDSNSPYLGRFITPSTYPCYVQLGLIMDYILILLTTISDLHLTLLIPTKNTKSNKSSITRDQYDDDASLSNGKVILIRKILGNRAQLLNELENRFFFMKTRSNQIQDKICSIFPILL